MAVIVCPECGNRVSEFAKVCPTCGCTMETILRQREEKAEKLLEQKNESESRWLQRGRTMLDRLRENKETDEKAIEDLEESIKEASRQYDQKRSQQQEKLKSIQARVSELCRKREELFRDDPGKKCVDSNEKISVAEHEIQILVEQVKAIAEDEKKLTETEQNAKEKLSQFRAQVAEAYEKTEIRYDSPVEDAAWYCFTEEKASLCTAVRAVLKLRDRCTESELVRYLPFSEQHGDELRQRMAETIFGDDVSCKAVQSVWGLKQEDAGSVYTFHLLTPEEKAKAEKDEEAKRNTVERELELLETARKMATAGYSQDVILSFLKMNGVDISGSATTAAVSLPQGKSASVIKRAVAGAIIAGPAGAIVGALSAVDKNLRK